MTQFRASFVQTRRDAWVEVNLANIEHNIKVLKNFTSPQTRFLAVVKADAYGHGSTMVVPTLLASGVDMLGVASVDEGIQLRESGIDAPILVLGSAPGWSVVSAVENDIQLSIFTRDHINACINAYNKLGKKPVVHIKVDTGMHRIGISHEQAVEFIREVAQIEQIQLYGVFTHLACAENRRITEKQQKNWDRVISSINDMDLTLHAVNTAGMVGYNDLHYDMVRSGIGIYGLTPDLPEGISDLPDFKQVMRLKGRIVHLQELPRNSGVSYGYSYVTSSESTKVATIPIGYADGVPRSLSNRIYGLINNKRIRQVGNITMDQMMFDVSSIDNIAVGDVITLLGQDEDEFISIDFWAKMLNTINYEITCRLKVRLPRVYTRE
ncbi:MAG: Alanine racemase [uncultured bacterium]|nr:MAG: Alanine racemase [uncultured bacterium]HBH19031.1 alanine racemase [Cyanobacteria bacterium UBA9579]